MNPKETKNNQIDSNPIDETSWFHVGIGIIVFLIFLIIFIYYCLVGNQLDFRFNAENMGQLGDYIGGLLNPILAFSSFMALLYTIKLQRDELKISREELHATREELKRSADTQQEQSDIFAQQQFESTFFSLLKEVNTMAKNAETSLQECLNEYNATSPAYPRDLLFIKYLLEDAEYFEFLQYKKNNNFSIIGICNQISLIQTQINSKIHGFQQLSLLIYQILKFIEQSSIKDKKQYSNILRACIPFQILQLLAINVYRSDMDSFESYKKMLEYFEFLEHMAFRLDGTMESTIGNPNLFYLIDIYKESAFGDSEYIKKLKVKQLNQYLKTKET